MDNRTGFWIVAAGLAIALVGAFPFEGKDEAFFVVAIGLALAAGVTAYMIIRFIALRFVAVRWASLISAGVVAACGVFEDGAAFLASVPVALLCLGLDTMRLPPVETTTAGDGPRRKRKP